MVFTKIFRVAFDTSSPVVVGGTVDKSNCSQVRNAACTFRLVTVPKLLFADELDV